LLHEAIRLLAKGTAPMRPLISLGEMSVAVAADRAFCKQIAVVLAGISRLTQNRSIRVFVLHDGYGDELIGRVAKSVRADVELCWIDARSATLDTALLPAYLPSAALYRLRVEELLPRSVERLIYLDADIAVRESLHGLWAHDLGDHLLAAVRDPVAPWAASPRALDWQQLGLLPETPYFNSGVMLIPLRRWREENVSRRALELLGTHCLKHADQCALNILAAGNWMTLSPRWNLQGGHLTGPGSLAWVTEARGVLEEALRAPAIIHYNHSDWRAPWETESTHPYRAAWYEDLDRTAWAGWRPSGSDVFNRLKLSATYIRRAARALSGRL
jgi:lipopolysaccharide biosynthesis glycosyltransferase